MFKFNQVNRPIRNVIGKFMIRVSNFHFKNSFVNLLNSIKVKNHDTSTSFKDKYIPLRNTDICPKIFYEFKPSMRFIQFCRKSDIKQPHIGIVSECGSKFIEFPINKCFDGDMINFIQMQINSKQLKKQIKSSIPNEVTDDIILLPPIMNPEKIICIANNYCNSNYSFDVFKQQTPIFHSKFANSLIGPSENIQFQSNKLDYGISLAVVIGKKGRYINKKEVKNYIFGYTIAQDITAKHFLNDEQSLIGKSMDTFCPLGPCIIHKCGIKNPHDLSLLCKINGESIQIGNTNDMIFGIEDIICELSKYFTFKPGDIILTGSPPKMCSKFNKNSNYLRDGDCIMSEIQCIGKLLNTVVRKNI